MLIQVTREHIAKGQRGSTTRCPVSLALRAMGYEYACTSQCLIAIGKVRVDPSTIRVYTTPLSAAQFIIDYDTDGPSAVEPFLFILEEAS